MASNDITFVSINDLPEVSTLDAAAEMVVNNAATPVAANKIKFANAVKPITDTLNDVQGQVTNLSEAVASLGTVKLAKLTQPEWEALGAKDPNTLYIVIQNSGTDAALYIGSIQIVM